MSRIVVEETSPTEISVVEDNAENIITVSDVGLQGPAGSAGSSTIPDNSITAAKLETTLAADISANTSARHAAVTVTDTDTIDFTLTGQAVTASVKDGSITSTKLASAVTSEISANTSARHSAVTVTDTDDIDLTLTGQDIQAAIKATAISSKTSKSSLESTEEILINDAGTLKKSTIQSIINLSGGGGESVFPLAPTFRGAIRNAVYYDQTFNSITTGTLTAENTYLTPFVTYEDLTIDRIGGMIAGNSVTTFRICIYAATDYWPDDQLLLTDVITTAATIGYYYEEVDFTFLANTLYWIGLYSQTAPVTYRCFNPSQQSYINFGTLDPDSTNNNTCVIQRTSGVPSDPWVFTQDELSTGANFRVPIVRFRAVVS